MEFQSLGGSCLGLFAMDTMTPNLQRQPFSVKLWPPSQSTREMLVERMTNNLSNPTIFTRKYGSLSREDASRSAKKIEDTAFSSANYHYEKEPDGDGSSAVQLYAKECSKLILDVLKQGPGEQDNEVLQPQPDQLPAPQSDQLPVPQPDLPPERQPDQPPAPQDDQLPAPQPDQPPAPQPDQPDAPQPHQPPASDEYFFDISKGQRAFIEAEEAEKLLEPLKRPGNSYVKICFSSRSFGIDAARVAAPILSSLKNQLKEVDLSDFVAGRPEAVALDVMNIFSEALEGSVLRFLNLSDNALGEKGVRAFEKLLSSQTSLEELYLMNDGISQEAAKAVCELLPSTKKLRVLHFHNNMTGNEGAISISEIVKCSPLLDDFRCSSTRVGSDGGIALSKALGECPNIKKLDLRDNMFGVEVGISLSKSLSVYGNLVEVYLSYLTLEDEGTVAVADALKSTAPSLEVLEMAGNDITAEAASPLALCIAAKPLLTKLNLSENELKDVGAIQISKALEGAKDLKEVDMSSNSLRRAGARTLAQVVVQKPEFKLLNVNGNFISEEGIDELEDIFKAFPNKLAPVDENEPGGYDDNESGDENEGGEDELESKMKKLDVDEE